MTTATQPGSALTETQVGMFHRDGFVIVKGLYDAAKMLGWKNLIQQVLADEKAAAGDQWRNLDGGVRVWNGRQVHPDLRQCMCDERVTPILNQVIGPDVEFLSVKAVFKNSTTDFPSPWHQDWFYWEGATKISVWIALDDATPANGCLKFIPGSHKKTFPKKVVGGAGFANQIDDKDIHGLPVVSIEVKRGDAVFFHDLAAHSSWPNTARTDRWSFISTYRNAAVKDECGLNADLWKEPMLLSGKSVNGGK